jgi:pimeloyl-ACP methyl ester carboxylesterase
LAPFLLPKIQADDFYDPERFPDWEEKYRDQLQYKGFRRAILSTIRNTPYISGIDEYRSLEKLGLPVLLVWGKEDKSFPYEDMELIMSALPDLEFYSIEESAHLPHYEQPDIVNPMLLNFLTTNNKQ